MNDTFSTPTRAQAIDEQKLMAFVNRAVGDIGAAMSGTLVLLGDKLGLYHALAGAGPLTSTELAKLTGTAERYVREWLGNQAADGYVAYDPATERYTLPPEQAYCLANENSPFNLQKAFGIMSAMQHAEDRMAENFRTGAGLEWGHHHPCLFSGTKRF